MTTQANNADRPVRRRWLSFSLRALFILTTLAAIGMGVVANRAHRQRAAVMAVKASGGSVYYDWQIETEGKQASEEPSGPKWLRNWIGDEHFQDVVEVSWAGVRGLEAEDLRWLVDLPKLNKVNLNFTAIDDARLEHLREHPSLRHVWLETCAGVTDQGLAALATLQNLESLSLMGARCSDEGVRRHVPGLRHLAYLDVSGIEITNATAREFQRLANLQMLHLSRVGQPAMHDLSDAVRLLKQELPGCRINYWPPESPGK